MFGRETILNKTPEAGGCTNTVDSYNPFPDGGGVALYQLNGDATDVSGNYDAIDVRGISYVDGVFGQAASFASNGNFNTGYSLSGSYTISLWQKQTASGYYVFGDTNSSGDNGIAFTGVRLNNIEFIDRYGGGANYLIHSVPFTEDNAWHHFVLSFTNDSNCKIYMDGALIMDFDSVLSTFNHTTPLTFGENLRSDFDPLGIQLDQVRIFSRALRPYEIEALYTEEYCTPTIVPSEHFNTVTYTGSTSPKTVTGVNFQPDFVWIKNRDNSSGNHYLIDSVRGIGTGGTYKFLSSDLTLEENSTTTNHVSAINDNGFIVQNNHIRTNALGEDYVAWNFKAGGAAVENTDGTITSQVSANTEAGFSIVKFTGSLTSGQTVGHGLTEPPSVVILKDLDSVANWYIYHKGTGTTSGYINYLRFDATAGDYSDKIFYPINFNASTFTPGNDETVLQGNVIAYCFAEVEGFSSFGSYVGTGASGNTVVTGFEPAFVMVKRTDATGVWVMLDNKRNLTNPRNSSLYANTSAQEDTGSTSGFYPMNFYENGFEPIQNTGDYNASGSTYIYMAFAADPTTVEPTLEDSFNTVLYNGNGGTQSVTGVGFQPDFVWIKNRDDTNPHALFDSVRGAGKFLSSQSTAAETGNTGDLLGSFDNDGFQVNRNYLASTGYDTTNGAANPLSYVAWNWKGAEIPAINSNGSIPSVVSANPAAGFSIVSYTGNGANGDTVGHGLSAVPNVVIWKNRSDARNWVVWHSGLTSIDYSLILNSTSAEVLDSRTNRPFGQPTDSVLVLGEDNETNFSANKFIAYCFAEVAGFSKFGSYTGTGGSTTVSGFGFEPAFLLIKRTDTNGSWVLQDNARGAGKSLFPDLSAAESLGWQTTFNSDGFNTTSGEAWINANGGTYIYMAFANQF